MNHLKSNIAGTFPVWSLRACDEHFPLVICDFQTTYWQYGKTREFRIKSSGICCRKILFTGTLAIYRIVNIWNDQQMSLISHFRSINSSFQKFRLKIANREWKIFHGELSAAANIYWCVFSGRIIYTEKE